MAKTLPYLKFLLKLCFIAGMLYWVLRSIDTEKAFAYLKEANPWYLVAAFVAFFFAQIASAFRTRYYFALAKEYWTHYFAIVFYFVGMFLNNLLPSSVGGDGYKIYFLKKHHGISAKLSLRLIVSERANGFYILLLLATIVSWFGKLPAIIPHYYLWCALWLVILTAGYFISIRVLLKEKPITAICGFSYSFIVQALNFACFTLSLAALGKDLTDIQALADYNMLFLVSSFLTLLPVSIGGAGIREMSLLYGGAFLGLDVERGVTAAFLFFLITTLCATIGAPYLHRLNAIYKGQKGKRL